MSWTRILLLLAVLGFAANWWKNHDTTSTGAAQKNSNGFISVVMPDGASPNSVVILAPIDCPSDAAQRADNLSSRLTASGIPNIRSSSYAVNITEPTDEQNAAMQRSVAVLNGEIPAVFVHGMGKANPTAEEVIAEYKRKK